jgi:glycosyltransferase involved in cell wall biosynthesis
MNICMVAYSFYESDSRIIQYARSLISRGDTVDVIALAHPRTSPFEVIHGVNLFRVQKREINEHSAFAYLFRILRFMFVAACVLIRKHLRRRYDLVHVHSVPDFLVFSALPLRLTGVPVILDIHDILPEFYASKFGSGEDSVLMRLLILVEKASAAIASHVIIANHLWYERITSRSVMKDKCSVVCNYPNPELFHLYPTASPHHNFRLMYPGSLNQHQGVDIAIRAFSQISSYIPDAEFHIYGEGPTRCHLENIVRELGLGTRVRIADYRPTEEIARIMATADMAVVPKRASSKFGNEAASTKIQEFMAVGVPVVVSRTKIDTFYFDDSMVRFFESENQAALVEAILDLYRHPEKRHKMVEAAQRHIEKNNWNVKQVEYLALVDSLLALRRHSGSCQLIPEQDAVSTASLPAKNSN